MRCAEHCQGKRTAVIDLPFEPAVNPCLSCGACCAFFRASFYYREADDYTPGGVPAELTEDLNAFRRMMKGTNLKDPRCIALSGQIGEQVHCSIYLQRSTVCRVFPPSFYGGAGPNSDCDRARLAHGLQPLRPEDMYPKTDDGTLRPAA